MGRLSARQVETLGPGMHADGDNLYLQVTPSGARSWILRYRFSGKRREMGLGSVRLFGLADARRRALEARRLLADGIDPIAEREAAKPVSGRTWGEAVDEFIDQMKHEWRNEGHLGQWIATLDAYGPDRALPVAKLDTEAVTACLAPIWTTKTETARRVRGRIERIWSAEKVRGTVAGENPARWRGHLEHLLAKPSKVAPVRHFRAIPFADVPAFYRAIRDTVAGRALRFTILTACRTGEVTGMDMAEVQGDTWIIPPERMKAGRQHRVPLTAAAAALLPESGQPFRLSENAMLYLLQRLPPKGYGLPFTVHGFRSSFRDWAAENGWAGDVVEMALAHTIKDKTEAAYRRGDLLDRRRGLMQAWADYLSTPPAA